MGGSKAQWLAYLLPYPAALGFIPSIPNKNSEEKNVNNAEVNQRSCLEQSLQWLQNVEVVTKWQAITTKQAEPRC